MSYRNLAPSLALSFLVALLGCSPQTGGGETSDRPASGDAGPTGSDTGGTGGSDTGGTGGSDAGDTGGSDTGDTGGSDTGGSDGGTGTVDTDAGMATGKTDGHIDDSCNLSVFAGFQLTIGSNQTDCDDRWTNMGDPYFQFTIGESTGEPVPGGRTYTFVPQEGGSYPEDGQVHGAAFGSSTSPVESGTLTIAPEGFGIFTGTYDVTLADGRTVTANFDSDRCPQGPGDCG